MYDTTLTALLRLKARFTLPGQRGSVTTEHVLWAVAVLAIVGVVVAAVTAYVENQAGQLQ